MTRMNVKCIVLKKTTNFPTAERKISESIVVYVTSINEDENVWKGLLGQVISQNVPQQRARLQHSSPRNAQL